jgi:hypothetical protein
MHQMLLEIRAAYSDNPSGVPSRTNTCLDTYIGQSFLLDGQSEGVNFTAHFCCLIVVLEFVYALKIRPSL